MEISGSDNPEDEKQIALLAKAEMLLELYCKSASLNPPVEVDPREPWQKRAECRFYDTDLFYPEGLTAKYAAQITAAKMVCQSCPVIRQCQDFAFSQGKTYQHGIWAGLTEVERITIMTEHEMAA